MLPLHIDTLSLITAVQAAVLALMLWVGIHGDVGRARTSLRIRALALGLEAAGWGILVLRAYVSPLLLLLGGNGLSLISQGICVVALRMLLGEPLRWRLVLAIGVVGWLGVAWFGLIEVDYRHRVLWGSFAVALYILLNIEALRSRLQPRGSRARNLLLLISVLAFVLVVWRNGELWLGVNPPDQISAPSATNFIYILFSGQQPLFASIGFLLLYNEILQQELHTLARIDPLTGVNNRLAIDESTAQLLDRAIRQRQSLGVLMLDADHFKSVNDRFGHSSGDKVLRALVSRIRATLRESDVIGRVGGEEFVVLSPGIDLPAALLLGERIRLMVESTPMLIDDHVLQLTVSVGVAVAAPAESDGSAVLKRADKALYAAKRAGRNRVMATAAFEDDDLALPA
ncbi:GGDEF domain-containing protein [Rhodanobacter sp. MP7CTX1]|uniref:GGDEF domain-containing protein n=1 Tax=Rhodanobacter sp. MP7CTX1 TaxID=2723084 RepID=UPI00161DB267|nr:GGDEF domain-containing protein [Rhodanobacter sp. MP7CTX1]MBB6188783.1 diguanylate cyclase (GGDEF)-like protein [Rhodanobacter sp. MP7CTX1]